MLSADPEIWEKGRRTRLAAGTKTLVQRRLGEGPFPGDNQQQVQAALQHELAGGLLTWQAIFREKGYIPTGMGTGTFWIIIPTPAVMRIW